MKLDIENLIKLQEKIPPHKFWISIMGEEAKIPKDMLERFKTLNFTDAVMEYARVLAESGVDSVELEKRAESFGVWYPLATGTQFVIDLDTQENKLKTYMSKMDTEIQNKALVERFKYPFDDIIISFQKGGKYLPCFITVFKMLELYINKHGEEEQVYLIKFCITPKIKEKEYDSGVPVFFEFQFIKSLFSKIFITCRTKSETCPNRVDRPFRFKIGETQIDNLKHVCLKSWNTCESCPELNGSVFEQFIPANIPFARQIYEVLKIVCFVLDRYSNRRTIEVQVTDKAGSKQKGHAQNSTRQTATQNESVIRITTISKKYEPTGEGTKHSQHKSPVEHERREHFRRYKNGKVIKIDKITVNKGVADKPIYKITD